MEKTTIPNVMFSISGFHGVSGKETASASESPPRRPPHVRSLVSPHLSARILPACAQATHDQPHGGGTPGQHGRDRHQRRYADNNPDQGVDQNDMQPDEHEQKRVQHVVEAGPEGSELGQDAGVQPLQRDVAGEEPGDHDSDGS